MLDQLTIKSMHEVMSIRQAAEALGVSYHRAYSLVRLGRLESTKVDGTILVSRKSVETFERLAPNGKPLRPLAALKAAQDGGSQ